MQVYPQYISSDPDHSDTRLAHAVTELTTCHSANRTAVHYQHPPEVPGVSGFCRQFCWQIKYLTCRYITSRSTHKHEVQMNRAEDSCQLQPAACKSFYVSGLSAVAVPPVVVTEHGNTETERVGFPVCLTSLARMSLEVTEADLAALEYSQVDLQVIVNGSAQSKCDRLFLDVIRLLVQELLGDALVEVQHHRELQIIDCKRLNLLKDQAECASLHADFVYTNLTQSNSQVRLNLCKSHQSWLLQSLQANCAEGCMALQSVEALQRELVSKSCEVSAAQLDLHGWKQKAAVQQLRLVSLQEDVGHQKVHIEALTAECSRRQEDVNVAQAQLRATSEQNAQLELELSQSSTALATAQVGLQLLLYLL